MADINELLPKIMSDILGVQNGAAAGYRANAVINIAILSILIKANFTTLEEAILTIVETKNSLPQRYQAPDLNQNVDFAIEQLRMICQTEQDP